MIIKHKKPIAKSKNYDLFNNEYYIIYSDDYCDVKNINIYANKIHQYNEYIKLFQNNKLVAMYFKNNLLPNRQNIRGKYDTYNGNFEINDVLLFNCRITYGIYVAHIDFDDETVSYIRSKDINSISILKNLSFIKNYM